jgi:hypothetical protein
VRDDATVASDHGVVVGSFEIVAEGQARGRPTVGPAETPVAQFL